jgi:pimeloyl-ACP methyl ester carboxylesterase
VGIWTDEHYGFRSVQQYVSGRLHQFLQSNDIANRDRTVFLVTGHSRGGAVANMLAAELNDNEQLALRDNLHTYTFASPNVTRSASATNARYDNIFNIINRNDAVPLLPRSAVPPNSWRRYGIDISISMTRETLGVNADIHHRMSEYQLWIDSHPNLTYDELLAISREDTSRGLLPRIITFKCPVDVIVHDSQGRLVAEIRNNVVTEIADASALAFVSNDIKQIFLPSGDDYSIRLIATDSGTLVYTVETVDALSDSPHSIQIFENIALQLGREMVSGLTGSPNVQLMLMENGRMTGEFTANGTLQAITSTIIRLVIGSTGYDVNGIPLQSDVAPFIDPTHDRTMVPLRLIAEALGAEVGWIQETRTVTIARGNINITLPVDAPLPGDMGQPAIVNDRTFVPVRYVSEMLGATVRWDGNTRAVYIED